MNAPGGRMNSSTLHDSGMMRIPNSEPAPIISLTAPSVISANEKPSPVPIPSNILATGLFLQAKDSARPRIMQFTTISGIYMPSDLFIAGRKAARII